MDKCTLFMGFVEFFFFLLLMPVYVNFICDCCEFLKAADSEERRKKQAENMEKKWKRKTNPVAVMEGGKEGNEEEKKRTSNPVAVMEGEKKGNEEEKNETPNE